MHVHCREMVNFIRQRLVKEKCAGIPANYTKNSRTAVLKNTDTDLLLFKGFLAKLEFALSLVKTC